MTAHPVRRRLLTSGEFPALPDDEYDDSRHEPQEGVRVAVAPPVRDHQDAGSLLRVQMRTQAELTAADPFPARIDLGALVDE